MQDDPFNTSLPLRIKRINPHSDHSAPAYKTDGAAGLDICAPEDFTIHASNRWPGFALVRTGFSFEIPAGFMGKLTPRSGLAIRHKISILNSPGVIDSDYRGEVMVPLVNFGPDQVHFKKNDRIAQLIIEPVSRVEVCEVDAETPLSATVRGAGGFGSTGIR